MENEHLYQRAKELSKELKVTTQGKSNEEWTEEEVRKLGLGIRALGLFFKQSYPDKEVRVMKLEEIERLAKDQGKKQENK